MNSKRIAIAAAVAILLAALPVRAQQDPYPADAVAYFDLAACPAGWDPYRPAVGRTIVSNGSSSESVGTELQPRQQPSHTHNASGTLTLDAVSLAGADGPNHTLARSGAATLSGTTGATTSDVPYVQLLVCRKMQAQAPGMKPPAEVVTFAASKKLCAADWAELTRVNGRYLVGLPQNGAPGVSFGGAPFLPGERRRHTHTLSGTWNPNQQGIALASGCCNNGFGAHREYGFTARADDAEAFVPYLELRACQPTGRD